MKFLRNGCLIIVVYTLLTHVAYSNTCVFEDRVVIEKYSIVPKEPNSKKHKPTFAEISKVVEDVFVGVVTFLSYFTTPTDKWKSADEYFSKPYDPNDRTF